MDSLGCFDSEDKLSKTASRKGQAFSSAIKAVTLNIETEIENIDDIKSGPFVFSDGCGEIEENLSKFIAQTKFGVIN